MNTFLDTGVFIAAYRGEARIKARARALLGEPERNFVTSDLLRLELLPLPAFHHRREEIAFYEGIFSDVVNFSEPLAERSVLAALVLAREHGLTALDALHLSLAIAAECQEFVTTERPGKSRLFNVQSLKVVSIA